MAISAIKLLESTLSAQVPELMALQDHRGRAGQVFVHVKEAAEQPYALHQAEWTACNSIVAVRLINIFIIFRGGTAAQDRAAEVKGEELMPRVLAVLNDASHWGALRSVTPQQWTPPTGTQIDFDDDLGEDAFVAVLPVRVEYVTAA